MLGKDHINISIAFVIPFLLPLIFLDVGDIVVFLTFAIAVFVGSLLPDADCGGKATIYYRFPKIDFFMKKVVGKSIIWSFKHLITKKKIKTEYPVGEAHRGIMHSPVGVFFSSLMLVVPLIIMGLLLDLFNWKIMLSIFLGLLIGQLLHLFEDSCTISGINWGFPFKTKELKGKIYTFSKDPERKDGRPMYYSWILYLLIGILFLGYSIGTFNKINIWLIFLIIVIYEIIALFMMIWLSKSSSSKWMIKKKTLKKIKKQTKKFKWDLGKI
jgi:membrane-bound metal-dependent hydrolase YbcI (DUF457 family)